MRSRLRPLSNHAQGLRWANVAIAVGIINSTLWVAAWTWITLEPPVPHPMTDEEVTLPFTQPMAATPRLKDFPEIETLPVIADEASSSDAMWTRQLGQLVMTNVGDGVNSLSVTLEEQARTAYAKGRMPVVWLVAPDCRRCDAVARALKHTRLQHALGHAVLIRVDATQFGAELVDLQLPVSDLPGFALLSRDGTPIDFMHAGEWDEDSPREMAPALESFVNHEAMHRRFPWRGGPRSDETPI